MNSSVLDQIRTNQPFGTIKQREEERKKNEEMENMRKVISGSPTTVSKVNLFDKDFYEQWRPPNEAGSQEFWNKNASTITNAIERYINKIKGNEMIDEMKHEKQVEFDKMMNKIAEDYNIITGEQLNKDKFLNEPSYRSAIIGQLNLGYNKNQYKVDEDTVKDAKPSISSHYSGRVDPATGKRKLLVPMKKVDKSITSRRKGGKKTRKRKIKKTKKYKRQKKSLTKSKKKRSKK